MKIITSVKLYSALFMTCAVFKIILGIEVGNTLGGLSLAAMWFVGSLVLCISYAYIG